MSTVQGAVAIYVAKTEGDEYGIYRKTESNYGFLLLSFSDAIEALKIGSQLADLLGLPFNSRLSEMDENEAKQSSVAISKQVQYNVVEGKPKVRKQVRGISLLCKQLYEQGKSTEEIIEELLPRYLEAGRTEKDGRYNIKWYLKQVCKV